MAPAQPTVFSVLKDDTILEDGKGNTLLFTKLPTSQYRPRDDESEGVNVELDQTRYIVRGISPVDATFLVPPHWHPYATEYFRVFAGFIDVTVDGKTRRVTPEDGEVCIPKRAIHSLCSPEGVHTELAERAVGEETEKKKSQFLKTLLSKGGQFEDLGPVQALRIFFADGDSYPSTGLKPIDIGITYLLGGFFGRTLGFGKLRDAPPELQ